MWGKESLCNVGQKRDEKKRKEKNITCVPANEAMTVAGVGAKGRMRRWRGGLRACGRGCVVIPLAYAMAVVPVQRRQVW